MSGKYYQYLQNITLTGDKRNDVIAVALSQMGYQEGSSSSNLSGMNGGSSNYTEFMTHVYANQSLEWCAAFCSWSLYQAQATNHTGYNYYYRANQGKSGYHWCEISCPYWKQALQFDGLYKNSAYKGGSYIPKTGDLIFFTSGTTVGHIGLVVYSDGTYVYTIEGNTSSGTGVESNGGGAYFKKYELTHSRIDGYGALDYPSSSTGNLIDYSGANPTTGLYMTAAYKYLYANEACTTRATNSSGSYVDVPAYTMVEVIGVSADKKALKVTYNGVTGYLHNNSTDRVVQLTTTATSGGNSGSGDSGNTGGNTGGTTGGVHQLQGVGVPSQIQYIKGIDISYFQVGGNSLAYNMIDFAKLKAAGCEYVILRAGDTNLSGYIDPSFIQLYKNAKAAGMPVGVYYFSRATTYAGSQAEAEWLINIMKQNNMQFEYPIYIDIETEAQGALSSSAADQLCLGWCETMEKAGYYPGIYSGTYVMYNKITSAVTNYYDLWIASYGTVDPAGPHWDYNTKDMASKGYTMWQYSCFNLNSSNNYVYTQGIYTSTAQTTPVTNLDLDVCYKDYPTIMKTYGYNGFASSVETGPENIVAGKEYTTTGTEGENYYANLTDGVAGAGGTTDGWCGWNSDGTVTFDLGENYNITGISVHLMNLASYGIGAPIMYIEVSDDGVNYSTYSEYVPFKTEDGAYWANLDIDGIFDGRYVRVKFSRYNGAWVFMNEIEIYGEKRSTDNLALGGNYTTSSDGSKHSTSLWQDDEIRLTDGTKNYTDIGGEAYAGWQASTVEVIVDLGRVKSTGTYSVYTASGNWGISAMKNISVSVSADGKNYTTVYAPAVYEVTGTGNDSVELAKFTVSAAKALDARYVKFTIKGTGTFVWLDEVEVTSAVSGSELTYENLLSGLTHTSTTGTAEGALTNKTNLTDGVALPYGKGTWFGLRSSSLDATNANTVNDSADFIYDLGDVYDISDARIHFMNLTGSGICTPKSVKIWISLDGVNYYKSATFTLDSTNNTCYWATADNISGMIGRYVKITIDMNADKSNGGGGWVMLNEIEVYGKKSSAPNGTINGVTYVVDGDNVIFTVTTTPDYNGVKVTLATDLYSHIDYASSTSTDANGNTVYTLTVPAVVGTTRYAFDGRLAVTNLYENEFYYVDVTVEAPAEPEEPDVPVEPDEPEDTSLYKSVSYEIKDDKIIFTVVTAAGDYNRIKVANAAAVGTSLGVGTSYTLDEKGNYVWTVKIAAPTESTTYAFDLRTSEMKYLKDYFMFDVEYVDTAIFKSVSYEVENG
ncbi:MAG: discoidin domain-containing protein, partial [Clostridia bacterium]|nr:discoidin domain-containing protein [Clostridia bacterium]